MTKKGPQNFRRIEIVDFGVKFLKRSFWNFSAKMCSDEFFLKHALTSGVYSLLQEKVYRSRIANVDELKTRMIDGTLWPVDRGCCYRPVASSSQRMCPCERSTLQAQILTVPAIYFQLFWLLNWWKIEEVLAKWIFQSIFVRHSAI